VHGRSLRLALVLSLVSGGACVAQARHPCAADARVRATALVKLHVGEDAAASIAIDDAVKNLPAVKALKGDGRFDVLEIWGHVYKADYRLRFLYARVGGTCVLMGQEIIEASDPY
jgi:hypothetical protein